MWYFQIAWEMSKFSKKKFNFQLQPRIPDIGNSRQRQCFEISNELTSREYWFRSIYLERRHRNRHIYRCPTRTATGLRVAYQRAAAPPAWRREHMLKFWFGHSHTDSSSTHKYKSLQVNQFIIVHNSIPNSMSNVFTSMIIRVFNPCHSLARWSPPSKPLDSLPWAPPFWFKLTNALLDWAARSHYIISTRTLIVILN